MQGSTLGIEVDIERQSWAIQNHISQYTQSIPLYVWTYAPTKPSLQGVVECDVFQCELEFNRLHHEKVFGEENIHSKSAAAEVSLGDVVVQEISCRENQAQEALVSFLHKWSSKRLRGVLLSPHV